MEILQSNESKENQLRKRREEKLLSLDDVASHLRLKKELIYDIESGNYNEIPPTYLKGYLRSYAKLLAISECEALQTLQFANNTDSISSWMIFHNQKQISANTKFIRWITYSIISILVVLVTLWWESDNLTSVNLSANDPPPVQLNYTVANNDIARREQ